MRFKSDHLPAPAAAVCVCVCACVCVCVCVCVSVCELGSAGLFLNAVHNKLPLRQGCSVPVRGNTLTLSLFVCIYGDADVSW